APWPQPPSPLEFFVDAEWAERTRPLAPSSELPPRVVVRLREPAVALGSAWFQPPVLSLAAVPRDVVPRIVVLPLPVSTCPAFPSLVGGGIPTPLPKLSIDLPLAPTSSPSVDVVGPPRSHILV